MLKKYIQIFLHFWKKRVECQLTTQIWIFWPMNLLFLFTHLPVGVKQGRIHGQYQSRTGGQGRKYVFSHFSTRVWRTDGPTNGRTDKASDRVACPRLKTAFYAYIFPARLRHFDFGDQRSFFHVFMNETQTRFDKYTNSAERMTKA